jgi:hypothetical protein
MKCGALFMMHVNKPEIVGEEEGEEGGLVFLSVCCSPISRCRRASSEWACVLLSCGRAFHP